MSHKDLSKRYNLVLFLLLLLLFIVHCCNNDPTTWNLCLDWNIKRLIATLVVQLSAFLIIFIEQRQKYNNLTMVLPVLLIQLIMFLFSQQISKEFLFLATISEMCRP